MKTTIPKVHRIARKKISLARKTDDITWPRDREREKERVCRTVRRKRRVYTLQKIEQSREERSRSRVKSTYANTHRSIDLQRSNNKTHGIRALHGGGGGGRLY